MARRASRRFEQAAPVFAALGDSVRLRLVRRLCDEGPLSITGLAAGSGVTRQAITKHLRVLDGAGLVTCARVGRKSVFQLKAQRLEEARRCLDAISDEWDRTLGRLQAFVEEEP